MTLRIEPAEPAGSTLARDYAAGRGRAAEFFRGSPHDVAVFREHWRSRRGMARAEREAVAGLLRPTSPRAAERLDRFVAHGGAVVTTGQQTGLFTGPLYTVYKALSAVALARSLERVLDTTVLPVFWCASEDHDWEEVNHAWIGPPAASPRRVGVTDADGRPRSIAKRGLLENLEIAFAELEQAIALEPFAPEIIRLVREAYRPGVSFAEGFRALLEGLLAPCDLLTVDAADPRLKARSVPLLRAALHRAREAEFAVAERTRVLDAAGYAAQVAVLPGAADLFLEGHAGRHRLWYGPRGWRTAADPEPRPLAQLDALLAAEPARFSPNVMLRPVVESAVLGTLAYVAGPGEVSYWAQLGGLFDLYEVPMPLVVPRASFTLVRDGVAQAAARAGLSWRELAAPEHELAQRVARDRLPAPIAAALGALRSGVSNGYAELMDAAEQVEPTLLGALGASRNAALLEASRAERKIVAAVRRQEGSRIAALLAARAELFPHGEPQERVLNVLPWAARYGPELFTDLLSRISPPWEAS